MPDILPGAEGFPRRSVLTPKVHRVLGLNPSTFTGPGTNTYIVGADGHEPVLIDTGSGVPGYIELLQAHLRAEGVAPPKRVLLTHVHPDHIGGAEHVLELFPDVTVHKYPWPEKDAQYTVPLQPIADGDVFRGEGYTLRAVYTPGHARDHICFHFEEERALFTGDVVLGVGTTVIPRDGGDLGDYMATLERLQGLNAERIYPGHGPVIDDAPTKLSEYLEHRLMRERQIVDELTAGTRSVEEIVRSIYREYPEHLYAAAGQSVQAHLDKLAREGRVEREAGGTPRWRLVA